MRSTAIAEVLARTELFGGLDGSLLGTVAERTVPRRYAKGQLVFLEGDVGESLYVVAEGQVKVYVASPEGAEMVLTTLIPPATFGELALLDGGFRSASVATVEPSVLLTLTRATLLELWWQHPTLGDRLLRHLGSLVRRLTAQASDLRFLDLDGRVAKLLIGFLDDRGEPAEGGIALDLQLTQADLAAMVGGSRQSVNQALRALEEQGYLELHPRRIMVTDPVRLRRRVES